MASENAKIDQNGRWALTFVANDGSGDIFNARVNPVTGALIVEAEVTSSNTQIGNTIPGGTAGSVLFLDVGSTLAQDNDNFFYDPISHFLGLGTNSPNATLDVNGTLRLNFGGDSTGDTYYRDSSGNTVALPIGQESYVLTVIGGVPMWQPSSGGGGGQAAIQFKDEGVNLGAPGSVTSVNFTGSGVTASIIGTALTVNVPGGGGTSGYTTIEANGTPVTQRDTMNFSNLFIVTDNAGNSRTDITINQTFFNLAFIGGLLNLATQVTGVLAVQHGGTGTASLTGIAVGNGTSSFSGTSIAQGDLFFGSATNVLTQLPKNTSATRYLSNTGSSNNPAWAQINLTNGVTGVLPIANGGTGQTTKTLAFNALSPLTTKGDIIVHNGTNNVRLGVGSDGQVLTADSSQTNGVRWAVPTTGGANSISATAGQDLNGSGTPLPVVFGDNVEYRFFGAHVTIPTFTDTLDDSHPQYCLTFTVNSNELIIINGIDIFISSGVTNNQLRLSIQNTVAGNPSGVDLVSGLVTYPGSLGYQKTVFSPLTLTSGTYAIVISQVNPGDSFSIGVNNLGGTNQAPYRFDGVNWNVSSLQPETSLYMTYSINSVYTAAQGIGNRMRSVIVNSSGGLPLTDTIPSILQTSYGLVTQTVSSGGTIIVAIAGAIGGFTGLMPVNEYYVTTSNGTTGTTGTNLVGRALLTNTILIRQ